MANSKGKRLRNKRRYSGQFICVCGQKWSSSDLMIQECEQCGHCGRDVCPTYLRLTTEVDTEDFVVNLFDKYFGQYQCYQCLRTWFSAHSWFGFAQQCRSCKTWTTAHKLRQLQRPKGMNNKNDKKKPHETDKCGKCKQLGQSCIAFGNMMKSLRNLSIK